MADIDPEKLQKRLKRILSRTPRVSKTPSRTCPPEAVDIAKLLNGEVVTRQSGQLVRITTTLSEMVSDSGGFLANFRYCFEEKGFAEKPDEFHTELQKLIEIPPEKILFLDIETTGLTAGNIFLIGTLRYSSEEIYLEQLFARDYSEEAGILEEFFETLAQFSALVTFNGKTFDLPFIFMRAEFFGLKRSEPKVHFDLLHEARRRWKGVAPDCKLKTLERMLCSRWRTDDVPSELVPEIYHDYIRTGKTQEIPKILYHNALDLISMCEIVLVILRGGRDWAE